VVIKILEIAGNDYTTSIEYQYDDTKDDYKVTVV